jgi:hypothetical protein
MCRSLPMERTTISPELRPTRTPSEINRAPVTSVEDVKRAMDKRAKDKPALFLAGAASPRQPMHAR